MDGIEATRRIVAAGSPTRVLVLTTFEGEELTFRALQAGACGYLLKDAGGARLVGGGRGRGAGEMPLGPRGRRPAGRVLRASGHRRAPADTRPGWPR